MIVTPQAGVVVVRAHARRAARGGELPARDAARGRAPGDARSEDHRCHAVEHATSPASTGPRSPRAAAPSARFRRARCSAARASNAPGDRRPAHRHQRGRHAPVLAPRRELAAGRRPRQPHDRRRQRVRARARRPPTSPRCSPSSRRRATCRCCRARASRPSTTRRRCSRSAPTNSSSPTSRPPRTTTGTATQTSPTITVQPFFSGIVLDVTPQIDEDGNIILHIHPAVSEVTESTRVVNLGGAARPGAPAAREEHGERDRHHRARAGRQHRRHRRPDERRRARQPRRPARASPKAGSATWRATPTGAAAKSELVILLKPTVIQSDRDWEQDLRQTRGRFEAAQAAGATGGSVNYLKHFGLRELPFGITPDTSFFFACRSIQEALNTLLVAVVERRRLHQDHRRSRHRQDAAVPQVPVDAGTELGERLHPESEPRAARPGARAGRGARASRRVRSSRTGWRRS